jgi:hypothetical protein
VNYNVDYFINKFEAIPEDQWCTGTFVDPYNGSHCALGHCGVNKNSNTNWPQESLDLMKLLHNYVNVTSINDGKDFKYQQETPKQRILAALKNIKETGKL